METYKTLLKWRGAQGRPPIQSHDLFTSFQTTTSGTTTTVAVYHTCNVEHNYGIGVESNTTSGSITFILQDVD